jgi:hypothetical protein
MDAETKETDYTSTISPELLNLSKCDVDFIPDKQIKCCPKGKSGCLFVNYILIFILFFLLFQIVLKLKIIHHKIGLIYTLIMATSFKVDHMFTNSKTQPVPDKVERDVLPNLNYILDFIQQIDKKHN